MHDSWEGKTLLAMKGLSLIRERQVGMVNTNLPVITRSRLVSDLSKLGIASGDTVMLHASVKAVGWIVGGPDMVLRAILDVLGSTGTLMMYVKCEEPLNEIDEWPEEWQKAYLEECPPFDPSRTRAFREWSILTEYLRTWPGACCSTHPEARMAAVGAKAKWITSDHPLQFGYGADSPSRSCAIFGEKYSCLDRFSIASPFSTTRNTLLTCPTRESSAIDGRSCAVARANGSSSSSSILPAESLTGPMAAISSPLQKRI